MGECKAFFLECPKKTDRGSRRYSRQRGELKSYCFVEGTLVDTTEGKKAIETIQVGGYVAAKNLEIGEVE
ncbi:MAG: hypothetical protein ACRCWY_11960 [Cellulosilyticaceae bacterium]